MCNQIRASGNVSLQINPANHYAAQSDSSSIEVRCFWTRTGSRCASRDHLRDAFVVGRADPRYRRRQDCGTDAGEYSADGIEERKKKSRSRVDDVKWQEEDVVL